MAVSTEVWEFQQLFQRLAQSFPKDGNPFLERCIYDQVSQAGAECSNVVLQTLVIPSGDDTSSAIGGIVFRPVATSALSKCAILFMHGGGYSFGSPNGHRKLAAHLADACERVVFSVDYRLSPEHPYPAAMEDCLSAYRYLVENGYEKIVLAGDSCGGGLCTSVSLALLTTELPMPDACVSLSPWYDLSTVQGGTMDSNERHDVLNTKAFLAMLADRYVGNSGADKRDPLISALFASDEQLKMVPPHWISVAGLDMMSDHGLRMAKRLKGLGVETAVEFHDGVHHAFELGVGRMPEADKSIREIGNWIKARCSETAP